VPSKVPRKDALKNAIFLAEMENLLCMRKGIFSLFWSQENPT